MGRGPGAVQRFILEKVEHRQECIPLIVLAKWYARDNDLEDTPHLRSSFRRAADGLHRDDKITRRILSLPTQPADGDKPAGHWRWVYCVTPQDFELSDSRLMGAAYAMVILGK